jgi:hypothetical protein
MTLDPPRPCTVSNYLENQERLLQPVLSHRHPLIAAVQALELALAQSRPMQQVSRQQPQN